MAEDTSRPSNQHPDIPPKSEIARQSGAASPVSTTRITIVIDAEMKDMAMVSREASTIWLAARLDRRLQMEALRWALDELRFAQGDGWVRAPELRLVGGTSIPAQRGSGAVREPAKTN